MHHRVTLVLSMVGIVFVWSNCGLRCCSSAPPAASEPDAIASAQVAASDGEIAAWLRDLSASEYAIRRDAFIRLWSQGNAALPAVREAAAASDQQTAETAKVLELLLKLEIKPQDNEELAEFLQLSRSATPRAIMALTEKGHWRLATELLKSNEAVLTAYRTNARQEWLSVLVQSALDQGDAERAWPVLELLLSPVQRQWIAQHAKTAHEGDESPLDVDQQALALLFRGEFDKAWALNPSVPVQQRIIFLSGRWELLSSDAIRALMTTADEKTLGGRAQRAAHAYLAGDIAKSNELIAEVVRELRSGSDDAEPVDDAPVPFELGLDADAARDRHRQDLMIALLICGEADGALELIPSEDRREYLMYYASRLEYDRALEAFGLKADLSNFETWLPAALARLRPSLRQASPGRGLEDFRQLCELSSLLVSMGKSAEGLRLFNRLIDSTQHAPAVYQDRTWSYLASQARQTQFRPHLIAILDQRSDELTPESRQHLFDTLYPDWRFVAAALWKFAPAELMARTETQPASGTATRSESASPAGAPAGESAAADGATGDAQAPGGPGSSQATASDLAGREKRWQLMERLWRFDRELLSGPQAAALVETWLKTAWRESSRMDEAAPYAASQLSALALRLGLRDLALTLANSGKGATALADVALATMEKNALSQAAQWWAEAVRADPRQHEWLLKYVSTCSMLGEEEKAQALEQSRWLRPLAVERAGLSYLMVANNLEEQGLLEHAREYGAAAFEMLEPDNPQMLITARIYAEILQELDDFSRSADVHRTANTLLLIDPNSGYPMSLIQHFIAQEFLARAVAELDRGQVEAALDRIARFERLRPAGIEICEHSYSRLVKNGRKEVADQLFQRCSQRMLAHLERWPNDAGSHNNLAWMYARCDLQLEEALGHAELAVRLSGGAPTYIDTLAETHFRLGHLDEAIELAEQCIKLDPRHYHYRKQLERFREARRARDS